MCGRNVVINIKVTIVRHTIKLDPLTFLCLLSSCKHVFFLIAYNVFQSLQPLQTIYFKIKKKKNGLSLICGRPCWFEFFSGSGYSPSHCMATNLSVTLVVPYIPIESATKERISTKNFEAGCIRNVDQPFMMRFDDCGRGSSQGASPSFGWGAWQTGRQSRRPDLILLTSNVMTATKKVIIITYAKVVANAA